MKELVVLGLGSNLGDSCYILREAVASLSLVLTDIKCSSIYKTRPRDFEDQSDFFNAVVIGYYSNSPESLLSILQEIECSFGRQREFELRFGPRTLDIDIEFFGSTVIRSKNLEIPHVRMYERQFVLVPLLELLPFAADPVTGQLLSEIASFLPDQGVKKVGTIYGI
ncbi:MAG TPA: 2-amino-4-hydroxy-6-hydroxymethyldihydropteridine diphosphokinase [Treponemataceae bacterium]|nr:2-amino-4-hydroxy-6-hydroxymethyldihydropteridine diphosphokinase [Treponemataceae bacterium]